MTDSAPPLPRRLDSWKAIAEYLNRDVATVRRWEKNQGLPVRRVAGARGHSVFAYASDIDDWLRASQAPSRTPSDANLAPAPEDDAVDRRPAQAPSRRPLLAAAALVAIAVAAAMWSMRTPSSAASLRFEAAPEGVVALDISGTPRWRYEFPAGYRHVLLNMDTPLRVVGGADPMILVGISQSARLSDGLSGGGVLDALDVDGKLRQSFSFDDEVTFRDKTYGAPWVLTSFAAEDTHGPRRVAVAAHHWMWDPSLVTILDEHWVRRGTFVHAGWIEMVRWLPSDRLLVGGFSNSRDAGMVALLDPDHMDGQGPEPPGSPHRCERCGGTTPLRMIAMPRTEVNRAAAAPFNRARVEVTSDRIIARTIEIPNHESRGAADAIYEFTPSLELRSASFSERYWEAHAELEAEGKLHHTRAQCPDRDGPRSVMVWDAKTGWRAVATR